MKRLCFGTILTILHQSRNNKVTITSLCENIAKAYGADITDSRTETAYNKMKGGTQNPPDEIIDNARAITIERLVDGLTKHVIPLLKSGSKKPIILALRDVIKEDNTIDQNTVIGFEDFSKSSMTEMEYVPFAGFLAASLQYAVLQVENTNLQNEVKEIAKGYVKCFDDSKENIYIDPTPVPLSTPLTSTVDSENVDRTFFPADSLKVVGEGYKSSANIYCVNMANKRFQFRQMKEYLFDNIGGYVLSRSRSNKLQSSGNPYRVGQHAFVEFQNTYKNKTENVLGEMLLYVFLESVLKAPKIMSRIELNKMNDLVSKSDGIHLYSGEFAGQKFNQVVFGASDLHGDLISAADRAFVKVLDVKENYDNEFRLVENNAFDGPFDDATKEYIKKLVTPSREKTKTPDMAFGMFLGYSMDLSSFDTQYMDAADKKMREDIADLKEYIRNKIISQKLTGYDFYIYVIPFNDAENEKQSLIDEMLSGGGL